uniref:MgtC/SapB/SrpB/YhiD N-terminal domain-containing protein n=1 Tax=Calcidiscus leptoporus TaxID=127549 RepID=A0A7S0INH0_9EUKA|mmetsp:Transcript_14328/g.32720  ORF Transcript_14328/g.32720 Transcript_14328/m.32720 type:complete len:306 (+) Transcript_14328:16-933(+)
MLIDRIPGSGSGALPFVRARHGFFNSFFSVRSGVGARLFYVALLCLTFTFGACAFLAPLVTPTCDDVLEPPPPKPAHRLLGQGLEGGREDAPNPSYQPDPCRWQRYPILLGMNKWECDMSRRIVMAILMGSIIGFERRRVDRPAGIRTMAMVCLGACVFTLGSMFAFVDGTMGWDASRVSAAIPSGVGFLGAASIWKGTKKSEASGEEVPEVHGLTTATSVWLSAAIGILCGGGLYVPGLFTTSVGVVYLRFAPRLRQSTEEEDDDDRSPVHAQRARNSGAASPGSSLLQPLDPERDARAVGLGT